MSFEGEFYHTIDVKNRLFIPAKFREGLGESFKVYPAPEGCLFCYTEEKWNAVSAQIMQHSSKSMDRTRQRQLARGVGTGAPDKQGRITLTAYQADWAGLKKDVVVYGVTDRVEIWDAEKFNKEMGEGEAPFTIEEIDDMEINF